MTAGGASPSPSERSDVLGTATHIGCRNTSSGTLTVPAHVGGMRTKAIGPLKNTSQRMMMQAFPP